MEDHELKRIRTDTYLTFGREFLRAGRYKQALGAFREALDLEPQNVTAMAGMSIAYARIGDFSEALKLTENMLSINARSYQAFDALGVIYTAKGDFSSALPFFEKSIKYGSDRASAYYNFACYWALLGDVNNCREYLEKALSLDPKFKVQAASDVDFKESRSATWFKDLVAFKSEVLYSSPVKKIAVPKLIIGANDDLINKLNKEPNILYDISPRRFEEVIAEIFDNKGYTVELTASTRDGGRDIIAFSDNMDVSLKLIIECKRFGKDRRVGIAYVQRLLGVKVAECANKALLVTTATFTSPARKFESEHFWDLELKDYEAVLAWAEEYAKFRRGKT